MTDPLSVDVPAGLADFARAVPDPEVVRDRLDRNRQEARFLRRLLKLAREAKAAAVPHVTPKGGAT